MSCLLAKVKLDLCLVVRRQIVTKTPTTHKTVRQYRSRHGRGARRRTSYTSFTTNCGVPEFVCVRRPPSWRNLTAWTWSPKVYFSRKSGRFS